MSFSTRQSILGSICLTQNVKISDKELSGNGECCKGIERAERELHEEL